MMCLALYRPLDSDTVNAILNSCAEFATNSVLWGRSDAFLAIQLGKFGLTAAVCDAGEGLLKSLCDKPQGRLPRRPRDDHDATFFASIYNRQAMGMFHTITSVLERGGNVTIASGASEIHWRPALWRRVQVTLASSGADIFDADMTPDLLGAIVQGSIDLRDYNEGIRRNWNPGLRGTRIAFELPFLDEGR